MALAISNECTATLVFDGLSLDFVLDVDSSVEATRTRVERGQSLSDIYLEAHICVRRGEADPTTRLLISEQDAGEFGIILSRLLNLIDVEGVDFLDTIDGKSLSKLIREKSSLAYSTDGRGYSFDRLSALTVQVVSESSFGRLLYYKHGGSFKLEAEVFADEMIFFAEVNPADLKGALENIRTEFANQIKVRLNH